jgi:hypothetical protein
MKANYNKFEVNETDCKNVSFNYTNNINKNLEEAVMLYSITGNPVELKIDVNNLLIKHEEETKLEIITEGAWLSFDGSHYFLNIYFYLSFEAKEVYDQMELSIKFSEKEMNTIKDYFLMEERCLIG